MYIKSYRILSISNKGVKRHVLRDADPVERFKFHVSGFKLFVSDSRNSEVVPETWNLKLETPAPG
jgi:hypothetical protein